MATRKRKLPELGNLERLLEYSKYLYEQENQRGEKLTSVTNIYLVVITFAFSFLSGLFSTLPFNAFDELISFASLYSSLLFILLAISIFILVLALIFTVLVIKVRAFERLCNPKEFVLEVENYPMETLIGSMISNYVVATERNILLNNQKATLLTRALQSYIIGFTLLVFTAIGIFLIGR